MDGLTKCGCRSWQPFGATCPHGPGELGMAPLLFPTPAPSPYPTFARPESAEVVGPGTPQGWLRVETGWSKLPLVTRQPTCCCTIGHWLQLERLSCNASSPTTRVGPLFLVLRHTAPWEQHHDGLLPGLGSAFLRAVLTKYFPS